MGTVSLGALGIGNDRPMVLIAGPCQLESLDHAQMIAGRLAEMAAPLGLPVIFKASFDKANRTSRYSGRGMGMDRGLKALEAVRRSTGLPLLTDVHETWQVPEVAAVVDVLQIPALLCRQTDLLVAAGQSGRAVNIKKGQFLAPHDMRHAAAKVAACGNENILLTERGTSFGYHALVSDMRALPIMAGTGYPVIMDATHAVQAPGAGEGKSGGERRFAPVLARAAVALGIAGVFLETHEDPDRAPSDGPNMIRLQDMPGLLADLVAFDRLAKARPLQAS